MTRLEFIEAVALLPDEKRKEVSDLLHAALSAINSVEVRLHGTAFHSHTLMVDTGENANTIWCRVYDLQQIFSGERTN